MNGVRVRITRLTDPVGPIRQSENFDGTVRWKGFKELHTYEVSDCAPFVHRRVLFTSTITWPVSGYTPITNDGSTATNRNKYRRLGSRQLDHVNTSACLAKIFQGTKVRDLLYGPVGTTGITVLEDTKFVTNGKAGGLRTSKRYWNYLNRLGDKGALRYRLSNAGTYDHTLEDGSAFQHAFVVDVFQFGLAGLDYGVPTPQESVDASHTTSRSNSNQSSASGGFAHVGKRSKVEPADMTMDGQVDDLMSSVEKLRVAEEPSVWVKVFSTMKVYWYDPK